MTTLAVRDYPFIIFLSSHSGSRHAPHTPARAEKPDSQVSVEIVQAVCTFGKPSAFTERRAVLVTLSLVNISHISQLPQNFASHSISIDPITAPLLHLYQHNNQTKHSTWAVLKARTASSPEALGKHRSRTYHSTFSIVISHGTLSYIHVPSRASTPSFMFIGLGIKTIHEFMHWHPATH